MCVWQRVLDPRSWAVTGGLGRLRAGCGRAAGGCGGAVADDRDSVVRVACGTGGQRVRATCWSMPPPKGVSKLPYGPCANAACPNGLCVLVECGCRCGYSGTDDVPRHNIFHPDCCARHPTDSCLFNPCKDSPWPVSADSTIDAIALGRQLGDPKYYDDHAMTGHSGSPDRRSLAEHQRHHGRDDWPAAASR
eukprot:COSAG03_NODE_5942_length_1144_cov_2.591388_2_plen_192_part_00